jgi:branched-chain amino acid transport system ATP-binding protein
VLDVEGLTAGYGPIVVLRGIDLAIGDGEIVAMIGPNGAGKSTTLAAIAGMIPRQGDVRLDGEPLPAAAEQVVRRGVALVPQGRKVFWRMTVEENLFMGAYPRGGTWRTFPERVEPIYGIFPRLAERRTQMAGSLSGGEQQMLVIARALLTHPRLLLVDEPSLGLAPRIVDQVYEILLAARQMEGLTLLINEQSSHRILKHADRIYVIRNGHIQLHDSAANLQDGEAIKRAYFGFGEAADVADSDEEEEVA